MKKNNMDYQTADKQLQGRNSTSRKIGKNTYLLRHSDYISIKYYNTHILIYYPDNSIRINYEGWQTVSTKARLNAYLPAPWHINQIRGIWYLTGTHGKDAIPLPGCGIFIPSHGRIQADLMDNTVQTATKRRAQIDNYSAGFVAALFAGKVPAPGPDDCFFCSTFPSSETAHFESHFEEKYYVPSLLVRAIDAFPIPLVDQHNLSCLFFPVHPEAKPLENQMPYTRKRLYKSLTRYLKRQFRIAS